MNRACTPNNIDCFAIDSAFTTSASIILFFWILAVTLAFVMAILKLIKIKEVHDIESYTIPDQPKQQKHPQRDQMRSPPPIAEVDNHNMNVVDFDSVSNNNHDKNPPSAHDPSIASNIGSDQRNNAHAIDDNDEAIQPTDWLNELSRAVDLFTTKHLIILIIFIFLVNSFASYIYAAVCMLFVFIQLVVFNYVRLFERLRMPLLQKISELSYHVWILTLFFAYFIHDQSLDNLTP